jgi:hypothetical protein
MVKALNLRLCRRASTQAIVRYRPGAGRDQLQMPPDRHGQT